MVLGSAENEHGSMLLCQLDKRLGMHATSLQAAEITVISLEDSPQALMAGQVLPKNLEKQAHALGLTELLVTSGPSSSQTTIDFWNRVFGKPVATAEDYDGPNFDRLVWRKTLHDD